MVWKFIVVFFEQFIQDKVIDKKVETYNSQVTSEYQKLYQEHPFLQSPDKLESIKNLLSSKTIKETFNFD